MFGPDGPYKRLQALGYPPDMGSTVGAVLPYVGSPSGLDGVIGLAFGAWHGVVSLY